MWGRKLFACCAEGEFFAANGGEGSIDAAGEFAVGHGYRSLLTLWVSMGGKGR